MGTSRFNYTSIKYLAAQLVDWDIKLNVIPINFMEGYVMEENQVET
jgi:hypothetical protein